MLSLHASLNPKKEASTALSSFLTEHKNKDILLLLSGGSAFSLLEGVDTSFLSERVTLSVLDERYTKEAKESNFSHLTTLPFFKKAVTQNVSFIDPRPRPEETLEVCGKRFDDTLKQWNTTHQDGIVLATLGIGADGHTAGIFPFPKNKEIFEALFLNPTLYAVGYTIPNTSNNPQRERITATGSYLMRHIHQAIIFATGEEKALILEKLKHNTGSSWEIPALLLHTLPDAHLYTDI